MRQSAYSLLYQANFPKSQAGKKSSVYYTVYNSDESIYVAKTNNGVVELGDGSYGVMLQFNTEGSWSIFWEIDSTPYVASEEINTFDFRAIIEYTGYGL
jgi:hypothetical protein